MRVVLIEDEHDLSDLKVIILKEDAMYFRRKAPGEKISEWRYNRDTNPLDHLVKLGNDSIIGLYDDNNEFCGYSRIIFEETKKDCFETSLKVELDFVYLLPSKRGSGHGSYLIEEMAEVVNKKIETISSAFPLKRKMTLNLHSMPVSPGGLSFSKKYMEEQRKKVCRSKFKYIDIASVNFNLDMSSARFKPRKQESRGLSYGT